MYFVTVLAVSGTMITMACIDTSGPFVTKDFLSEDEIAEFTESGEDICAGNWESGVAGWERLEMDCCSIKPFMAK